METLSVEEKQYNKLREINDCSTYALFNAVCSEFLWMHYHKVDFARMAINAYYDMLADSTSCDSMSYTRYAVAICRIYSKCKINDFHFDEFFEKSIEFISSNLIKKEYYSLFVLSALSICKERSCEIENAFNDGIQYYEKMMQYDKAVSFLKGLEKYYGKDRKDDRKSVIKRTAQNYEKQAECMNWEDPANSFKIISLIHNAMLEWKRLNEPCSQIERKRLAKRIEPIKKLNVESLQKFNSGTFDIRNWIKRIEEFIESASFETAIYNLTKIVHLTNPEKLSTRGFSFTDFTEIKMLDSEGRITCIVPSADSQDESKQIAIFEHHAREEYLVSAQFIEIYLKLCRRKFQFNEENLGFLFDNNAFVSEKRKGTFLKGIVAGFNFDFTTSMHLLMPQVEYCIRNLAQECGAVVYKTDDNGEESCLGMDGILNLIDVKDSIDEELLFNFRVFYTSKYGFGMRNVIAHGMYSDDELQSYSGLVTWWFTLRVCCMYSAGLFDRLHEQAEKKESREIVK